MLKTHRPDYTELDRIHLYRATCLECGYQQYVDAKSIAEATSQFFKLGWRTWEDDDCITGNTCPPCIEKIQNHHQTKPTLQEVAA